MSTLFFAIATEGESWGDLHSSVQNALTAWIYKNKVTQTEIDHAVAGVVHNLKYSPFTATVHTLTLFDYEREQGVIYTTRALLETHHPQYRYVQCTEMDMLEKFWGGIGAYTTLVSYGGKKFDFPFLWHRAHALGINTKLAFVQGVLVGHGHIPYHIDMQEVVMGGVMRTKPALSTVCHGYAIPYEVQNSEQFDDLGMRVQALILLYARYKSINHPLLSQ